MDDEPPDLDNQETGLVATLEQPNSHYDVLTISELNKEHNSIKGKRLEQCPLLFKCRQKGPKGKILDANCIGDTIKFSGCHIFREKGLTAPPKKFDVYGDVLEQCNILEKIYETIEQNCRNEKQNLEQARQNYEQANKGLFIFEEKYFI